MPIIAQTTMNAPGNELNLENIWKENKFAAKSVPGFFFLANGEHYTKNQNGKISSFHLLTGDEIETIFDAENDSFKSILNGPISNYYFSADEQKLLILVHQEAIYRRSSKANVFFFDRKTKRLSSIENGKKIGYPTFSPDGNKVAYVLENNLFIWDIFTQTSITVTSDGSKNNLINGAGDWVYEEEFGLSKAFEWSPDSKFLAFLKFDESKVPQYTMTNFNGASHPEYVTYKYPKVGEENAKVGVGIYNLSTKKTSFAVTDSSIEYIPRIEWTNTSNHLSFLTLNRHQNHLKWLLMESESGSLSTLLEEKEDTYVDINDHLTFLIEKEQFIRTSESSGWNHLYLYSKDGKMIRSITKGQWEVTEFYGMDEKTGWLYFQAALHNPKERQICRIKLDGSKLEEIAEEPGWNSAQFNTTKSLFILTHSSISKPPVYSINAADGTEIKRLEENDALKSTQVSLTVQPIDFFDFQTSEKVKLNGWMIKPANFNPQGKYPVLMFVYGGPGSQQVTDQWKGQNYWWFQMLAQKGFVVACVDNRGTGGRGATFKKTTYLQLGKYETEDQIEAAKYIGNLSFVDASRIGIFGWSYGGFMSSLCLLKGNDVFSAAVAVAPVTHWKWYDNIYTERYMRTVSENPKGYHDNAPVHFAHQLKGKYLLIHGMADDNVHFQHTTEMANVLISEDKQFDTYFYPNKNHSISGGSSRLHLYRKITDFLILHLRGGEVKTRIPMNGRIEMMRTIQDSKGKQNIPVKE
jgi:dipeptidyl-peptidase-4